MNPIRFTIIFLINAERSTNLTFCPSLRLSMNIKWNILIIDTFLTTLLQNSHVQYKGKRKLDHIIKEERVYLIYNVSILKI